MALLTIVVPTYNRADCLALLLDTLAQQLAGLEERVVVVIGDNASTDHTAQLTDRFARAYPSAVVIRHPQNIGPEANFCECLDRVATRYLWIIGDDDLPKPGLIDHLCRLLESQQPDLVYLSSVWLPRLESASMRGGVQRLQARPMARRDFADRVNTWFTFISGNVVNLDAYRARHATSDARQHIGSSLVQLHWTLNVLLTGDRFLYVEDECILATAGNTGGYAVLTVFGATFPRMVRQILSGQPSLARVIIHRHMRGFLPGLIWQARFANIGRFDPENAWSSMARELGRHPFYWLVHRPIGVLPKPASYVFYLLARVIGKLRLPL